MSITHEQNADVGVQYLEAIKDRLATREKAQAAAKVMAADLKDSSDALLAIARRLAKKHRLEGAPAFAKLDDDYVGGGRINFLKIKTDRNEFLNVPEERLPELVHLKDAATKRKRLAEDLCQEIEFLHGMLAPTRVAGFQAHVARMWAPASKEEKIASGRLRDFVEDFLTAARPATCQIG